MVIQRWQSVYLLIASIMMACFCFVPIASVGDLTITAVNNPVYLTLNILIALLLLLSIFMFKNLARQKTVVKVSLFLIIASAVAGGIVLYKTPGEVAINWSGALLLLGASFVIALAALGRIRADEKLLKSYDRIR